MASGAQVGFFRALFGLSVLGGSHLACVYEFEILKTLGMYGALGIVFVVLVPLVVLGLWLRGQTSPGLRALGLGYESVFEHLALMLGVVSSLVVYWAVSAGVHGTDLPATRGEFLFEFFAGASIFAAIVYGVAAGMAAAFSSSVVVRVLSVLDLLVLIAVPVIGAVLFEEPLRGVASSHGGVFTAVALAYLAGGSVVTWRLFVAKDPEAKQTSVMRAG
ncbi:MAG: hypothetical protein R3B13_20070 [Polyangiaceae bacterium]